MTDWKEKPHWVLRFNEIGRWELIGPGGDVKHIDGLGQRELSVTVAMESVPEFNLKGILVAGRT